MTQEREHASILVVDDAPDNLWMLTRMLGGHGYRVEAVSGGEQALAAAASAPPDLILLDILMPSMDGFEVCRRLKQNCETAEIPVIFLSALGDMADKIEGFSAGGVDYITKPFHGAEVRARIETHLTIRSMQRSLKRQIEERDELIADLDAFAHSVAHDLKNPLCLIFGYADWLRSDLPSPTRAQAIALDGLERTSAQMGSIIEELLLLSSVRKTEVVPTGVDMGAIVSRGRQRLQRLIVDTQAEISAADTWPSVLGHAPWIEQVWVNYLSNACKYGGRPPKIELGWTAVQPDEPGSHAQCAGSAMLRFWVRDHGQGIALEDQPDLFAPFTRLAPVRVEGYGLGLSIVKRIVTKLNGRVGVESAPGVGATFYFTLPAADKVISTKY